MEKFLMGLARYAVIRLIIDTIVKNKIAALVIAGGVYYASSQGLIDVGEMFSQGKDFVMSNLNL